MEVVLREIPDDPGLRSCCNRSVGILEGEPYLALLCNAVVRLGLGIVVLTVAGPDVQGSVVGPGKSRFRVVMGNHPAVNIQYRLIGTGR